jgi:hypothetical protein
MNAEVIDEDETIIEKIDRSIIIGKQEERSVTTHNLHEITPEELKLVYAYLSEHPGYSSLIQQMNMGDRVAFVRLQMQDHGWTPSGDYASEPPEDQISRPHLRYQEAHIYRSDINRTLIKVVNKKFGVAHRHLLSEINQDLWNSTRGQLLREAKQRAGEPTERELEQIQKLTALEDIIRFLEAELIKK